MKMRRATTAATNAAQSGHDARINPAANAAQSVEI